MSRADSDVSDIADSVRSELTTGSGHTSRNSDHISRSAAIGGRSIVPVPIASLIPGDSPRLDGQDAEHVARLAELDEQLPPILVDRRTMRVIDGMHRLLAACLRGQDTIAVEFFDGTPEEAFLRAVEANVTHGLPLSQEDRRAAAVRIVEAHPQMSDRAIAKASGLGTKSVASLRRSLAPSQDQPTARIGRDGKVRPLNSAEGRRRAAELITENPQASLREVARRAGISPATVSDVRKRLLSGELPVAERRRATGVASSADGGSPTAPGRVPAQRTVRKVRLVQPDPVELLDKLIKDPSLRHKEDGRQLLRLLQQNALAHQMWSKLAAVVPTHCRDLVVDLARQYAETWSEFAQELGTNVCAVGREVPQQDVGMGA